MVFMDDKVRNHRLQLQGRCRGNRAAADVDLYADIIGVGHVTDFLALCQAACVAQVWLDDAEGTVLIEGTVAHLE